MADKGRLGQPRGARRVDQQRRVVQRDAAFFFCCQRPIRQSRNPFRECRAMAPDHRFCLKPLQRRVQPRIHDNMLGRRDRDAMRQAFAAEMGIDQCHHGADARQAQPDGQILRPIGHQQADYFTLGDALAQRPAGILVCPRGKAGMAETLARRHQGRRRTEARAQLLDHQRKDALRCGVYLRRHFQRPQPCSGCGIIGRGDTLPGLLHVSQNGTVQAAQISAFAWKSR